MRTGKKAPPIENAYSRSNAGTKSTLSPALSAQIVEMARNGKINAEIITFLGIPEDTFYTWTARNTADLKDRIDNARRSYLLDISEQALTKLAQSKSERIQLDAVKYLSERLGKKWYATRQEYQQLEEDEGKELEPENKEKLQKLLNPLQTKDENPASSPILSPIQPQKEG